MVIGEPLLNREGLEEKSYQFPGPVWTGGGSRMYPVSPIFPNSPLTFGRVRVVTCWTLKAPKNVLITGKINNNFFNK